MLLPIIPKNYNKIDKIFIFIIIIVSLGLFWLNYTNRISINQLLIGEITLSLALVALLLPPGSDIKSLSLPISFPLWVLPVAVYLVSEVEILLFRHTGLCYLLTLALALILTVLAEEKPAKKVAMTMSIIGVSLIPLYSLYVPSFGNDTWRDIIWALRTLKVGHVTKTGISHIAYPFPMVPLEYALMSLVSGLDPAWASVVTGLLYLLQLPLLVFLLSRRFGGFDDFKGAFVLLMVPLVVKWSAWYIPQVYSLTLFLTAFLAGSALLRIPLLVAGVFGHGGVATWMVLTTAALWISKRGRETAAMLLNLIIIFAAYVIYTSLLYALSNAYNGVMEAVLAFLRGEKILVAAAPVLVAPPTTSLGNLALSVLSVSGLLVILYGRGSARTLAFLSGTFLVIAYIGASAFPAADLSRYLGLPSAAMLAVFAPYAFELLRRRRYGSLYSLLLVAVAIFSFAYSGVFAPKNPYTNPYELSLSGLVSYGDALQIRTISQLLAPGTYLTDWRSGLFIASTYLDIQPQYRGFRYKGIEFIFGGSYGLYVDLAYLQHFSGLIILRQESSNMSEVYSPDVFVVAKNLNNSIFYSNNDVTVWAR